MKSMHKTALRFVTAMFALTLGISVEGQISRTVVTYDVHHDISLPLLSMAPTERNPEIPASQWPGQPTRVVSTTPELNFGGVGAGPSWGTADTSGAAGATQYVQAVNTQMAVYNKSTGALIKGPIVYSSLFKGFGGPCQTDNGGDPNVQYDKAASKWVISHHTQHSPYYECMAVSTTSDATGSYYRYAFLLPSNYWPDYPKVGVWSDAYYIEFNLQDMSNHFSAIAGLECAVQRSTMLTGGSAQIICFQVPASGHDLTILPSDLDGSNPPPAGAPNYFLQLGVNSLNLYQFHVDFQTPANSTFTGPTVIPVQGFQQACGGKACIPQLDTTQVVDGVGERLMNRVAYRNPPTANYDVIVATHSVNVANPRRTGIRWYEIRNPGAQQPTVYQQGTFAPDSNYRWVGSIGMDQMGDIAVGYSVSSTTMHPAISYTGRVPGDRLGTMEAEANILTGSGSQQTGNSNWTDVTSLSIDPVDDCTFWYTNQYYQTDSKQAWSTEIASFRFNSCP